METLDYGYTYLYGQKLLIIMKEETFVYIGTQALENVKQLIGGNHTYQLYQHKIEQISKNLIEQPENCCYKIMYGTSFQREVWQLLENIPKGKIYSYSQLAIFLQKPTATRAVANAIAKNPLLLLIPCHRVITKKGTLGGYSGGVEMKKKLLAAESVFL